MRAHVIFRLCVVLALAALFVLSGKRERASGAGASPPLVIAGEPAPR